MSTVWIKDIDGRDRWLGSFDAVAATKLAANLRWAGYESWTEEN